MRTSLDLSLNRRFGRPAFPQKGEKFGFGVGFAFGIPTHLKLKLATETDEGSYKLDEVSMLVADWEADGWETRMNLMAEYLFLAGPPKSLQGQIPGYDPY